MTHKQKLIGVARDADCYRCSLGKQTEGNVCVFGRGNLSAPIFLVGEAPGKAEAETGKPFMGTAGKLLNRILDSIGMTDMVYISNAVRCRPPDNRTPTEEEIDACRTFLSRELNIVSPRVIVAMGKTPAAAFDLDQPRGVWTTHQLTPITWTWHPAYCLRSKPFITRQFASHLRRARSKANENLH